MSGHSPGPWRTIGHPHDRPLIESADGELVADLVDRESIAETLANASLLASAPDLVRQLEAMRERAESAEARIAEVSGVTREQLARREYERGLAEGKARRSELLVELRGWMAQHCCGCGHPACKRCADDNAAAALVARVES